jgi:ABC-type uncharacterized transport system substrate-binding protein
MSAGGLMSCGASLRETYRQDDTCVGKILVGPKPANLPLLQPTRIELVINLNNAKALVLTIRQALVLHADELIQ